MAARIAVCVLNWNRLEMLQRCVRSILDVDAGAEFDLIINDVGSTDDVREAIYREYRHVAQLVFDPPSAEGPPTRGYAESVNRVLRLAFSDKHTEFAFPLNNDNTVTPGWLVGCLQRFIRDREIGHVGPMVLYGPSWPEKYGYVQSAGACFVEEPQHGWVTKSYYEGRPSDYPAVLEEYDAWYTGFGMYRRDLFEELGGLSEDYPPIYFDDADWGLRVWANQYRVAYTPHSIIFHDHPPAFHEDPTRQHHITTNAGAGRNRALFLERWQGFLRNEDGILPPIPEGALR